jgi:hypothetical protein
MKVDLRIPQLNDLVVAYNILQSGNVVSISDLVQYSMWTRFDPRLGEILIRHLQRCWSKMNPLEVHKVLKDAPMPLCWGILCDHVLFLLPKGTQLGFKNWRNCCLSDFKKSSSENYFLGLYSFAGKKQRNEAFDSLPLYKKWGYLSCELMLPNQDSSQPKRHLTLIPKGERIRKLKKILNSKKEITVHDYLEIFPGKLSRRVAEMDLKLYAIKNGNTRSAIYRKK